MEERRAYCGMAGTRRCAVLESPRKVSDLTFERRMAFLGLFDFLAALMQLARTRIAVKMCKRGGHIIIVVNVSVRLQRLERSYVVCM